MSVFDSRKNKRQKSEAVDLLWTIDGTNVAGKGRLVDISLTGLSIEIVSTAFQGRAGLVFSLQIPKVPDAPPKARLRWYRRVASRSTVFVCGLSFVQPHQKAWLDWIGAYMDQQNVLSEDAAVTIEDVIAMLKSDPRPVR